MGAVLTTAGVFVCAESTWTVVAWTTAALMESAESRHRSFMFVFKGASSNKGGSARGRLTGESEVHGAASAEDYRPTAGRQYTYLCRDREAWGSNCNCSQQQMLM